MTMILMFGPMLAGMLAAGAPAGFAHWSKATLQDYQEKLAAKLDPKTKSASERLDTFDNHFFMIAHREGDGEAELHEGQADVFVVESGAATLVVGGEIVGARTSSPGEVRGTSIQGGERVKLGVGDVVHIAARTPHQLLIEPGGKFTYFVMKVDVK
jgi:mannose-6-phosphate isomerase-like protein (cupin superfamily)